MSSPFDIIHPALMGSGIFGVSNILFPERCKIVHHESGTKSSLLNAQTTSATTTVYNDVPCQITPDMNGIEVPDVGAGTVRKSTHTAVVPRDYTVTEAMSLQDEDGVFYNILQVARDALGSKTILRVQKSIRSSP